ncbi:MULTISPECIES: KAP family NTPase [unclassified Modicisalibacter]|uniref:KAP family NTPase n=1 Tax=unclassified Modicisalibacter TaxID=2679913 RepID=UPI001CCA88FF|nr:MULTISPECIES: KAP family NTPase [unclassified Modicisalibacter]MBZ9559115.1 KAP family NTPase [Modicisalibacter sp. R2A 31.J]MBZ9576774.1 KAP family NTPase [Modicisalibacter sp. MOD 31.J]
MASATKNMKMPELLIFAKSSAIGFILAEVWRTSFYMGSNFSLLLNSVPTWPIFIPMLLPLLLCIIYAHKRKALTSALRIVQSLRVDILFAVFIGIWVNELASNWLAKFHTAIKNLDPNWAPAITAFFCAIMLSQIIRHHISKRKARHSQLYFVADEEIGTKEEDLLENESQAESFASMVLESGAHSGLIFGVDGAWGVGKTSFINLAERYWNEADDKVIVCRFEPLRYASEPNITDRLIRDLSSTIQHKVFVPEFKPVATRYSRLLRGKADISFLGFKLSLDPSQDSADELLEDIDNALKYIGRRVIIVIDDLDRLDTNTINNVLFATRRTFNLSQATYILCYDTEILTGTQENAEKARNFIEKFVTVKLNLFIDSSSIRDFLRSEWKRAEREQRLIPADTMLSLGSILNELADILDGDMASHYLPLIGNMRKIKRFINAMLMMQLEKSDLGQTDFSKQDLINLILLNINYPGLFRQIYSEETDGRSGSFSVKRSHAEKKFLNSEGFEEKLKKEPAPAAFLIKQLFDADHLKLNSFNGVDEPTMAIRACFNQPSFRNLENYLKLLVRFVTPDPKDTFSFYQRAVDRIQSGTSITSILESNELNLRNGAIVHDKFWKLLVNQSHELKDTVAQDAINTLVDYLPYYPSIEYHDRGLRQRSIFSLLLLLDRRGWIGRPSQGNNSAENTVEIAHRIFGEDRHQNLGLLQRLSDPTRGILGWNDLMLFRLQCSADRNGQLYNLQRALIVHQDPESPTTGQVNNLAKFGMREISQETFAIFKRTYIDTNKNFITEADSIPDEEFLGSIVNPSGNNFPRGGIKDKQDIDSLKQRVPAIRSSIKTFIIYQLSNSHPPTGSGVGCGYYDESGTSDSGHIAKIMNQYMFDYCFNPDVDTENSFLFLDFCLSNLSNSFFYNEDELRYFATKEGILGGLNPKTMGQFWTNHKEKIREVAIDNPERQVVTINYIASYSEDLGEVFCVLDELSKISTEMDPE